MSEAKVCEVCGKTRPDKCWAAATLAGELHCLRAGYERERAAREKAEAERDAAKSNWITETRNANAYAHERDAARNAAEAAERDASSVPPESDPAWQRAQKPSIGRIVHYYPCNDDKQPRAAIITDVLLADGVDLAVFQSCHSAVTPISCAFFSAVPTPGCWSWPPRT